MGTLNRSRKGESSGGMPGACSPGKILKFKSSEMAGNGSCKQIYIDKKASEMARNEFCKQLYIEKTHQRSERTKSYLGHHNPRLY